MKVIIVGRGVSGLAAARLAAALGWASETVADGDGFDPQRIMAAAELVVLSPGVRPESPLYRAAVAAGRKVISELEFGFCHFPNPLLAVTGTNGKTTTVELTAHLLKAAGVHTVAAGNIGLPLSEVAAELLEKKQSPDLLPVVEVSSFQLERCIDFSPLAAVILNIESDHLDRYPGGLAEYAAVKRKIFHCVPEENQLYGRSITGHDRYRRITDDGDRIFLDGGFLLKYGETRLQGEHNLENLVAALELCCRVLPAEAITSVEFGSAVRNFRPGAHRLELIAEKNGVQYINDSKATNPAAVVAALKALAGETNGVLLLLGGLDKDMDFSILKKYAGQIRQALVFGECRRKISEALAPEIACRDFGVDFAAAVEAAAAEARPGETVLLAPGCASMDMFRDYRDRGDAFRRLVQPEP